eukprot:jgi/Galph1/5750/GphlegSOOS_G4358.1
MNFVIDESVKKALQEAQPIVALESTIISHGMPFPENVQTALQVEQVVRKHGAVPATIAIIQGQVHIGLKKEEIEYIGQKGKAVRKCSTRDLAFVLSEGLDGATTVAATMVLAHKVGIDFFVTGGIGGAHRGCESTFDISADLLELGKTPVNVICSGAKSVLDIPKTLEILETQGVTVITYGQETFPAFYCGSSGIRSPLRIDSLEKIAQVCSMSRALSLQSGIVIAVPIPEKDSMLSKKVQDAIEVALNEVEEKKIVGAAVTPFLLERVAERTAGDSLRLNIELILHNAAIGAQIACHYKSLQIGQI